jgi:uncharacterized membrane protein (DUF2068 family)
VGALRDSLRRWLRWELSRRIELTVGLRLIVLDRAVKFVALTAGAVALLVAVRTGALLEVSQRLQTELNLRPGRGLWLRLTSYTLRHFTSLSRREETALAVAAILYGVLEGVEGAGLLLRRRWAEYLVLLATAAFIPLEIDELVRRPTPWKGIAFAVNVVIVVYLVRRKRLFLDRPPASADAGAIQLSRCYRREVG